MAPKIDRRNLRTIKVREGEPIALDVKISGEPPPDVAWSLNGKSVTSGNGLKCKFKVLFMLEACRSVCSFGILVPH